MKEAALAIRAARRVAIVSHRDPDGDTIGSAIALGLALESMGKTISLHCADPVPASLAFLPGADRFQRETPPSDVDWVVTLDLGDAPRAKLTLPSGVRVINIDHHASNTSFGAINWIDPTSAATGEMVARIIDDLGAAWTPAMATATLVALMTDTGSFQFPNTDDRALELAAKCRARGADLAAITYNIFRSRRFEAMRLWGAAFSRVERDEGGLLVWTWIDGRDLDASGAREEDATGIVEQIARSNGNRVALFFSALTPGEVKMSCRTPPFEPAVDASALMGRFGGGGHARAAGALVPGDFDEVKGRVLEAARDALRSVREGAPVS